MYLVNGVTQGKQKKIKFICKKEIWNTIIKLFKNGHKNKQKRFLKKKMNNN